MRQYKYIVTGENAFGHVRTMGYTNNPKSAHKWADEIESSEPGLIGNVTDVKNIGVISECYDNINKYYLQEVPKGHEHDYYNMSLYEAMRMLSDHEMESILNNLEVRIARS